MNTTPNTPISDDELGAALGASVRSRVDDVATITPAFDGVERRARQITHRRRAVTVLAVGALVVFGGIGLSVLAGDDEGADIDDVVTEPDPEPDTPVEGEGEVDPDPDSPEDDVLDIPDLFADEVQVTGLVDDRTRFIAVDEFGAETTLATTLPGARFSSAVLLADGSVLGGSADGETSLVGYTDPGGDLTSLVNPGSLVGAAIIDDVPYAFVTRPQDGAFDVLEAINLTDQSSTVLVDDHIGPFDTVDVRGDLIIVPLVTNAGREWRFVHPDGTPAYGGTAISHPENAGISPRFSRTGQGLWWLESNIAETEWWLVGGTVAGAEAQRIALDPEANGRPVFMNLELTDGLMVVNILPKTSDPLEFTTIWIDPDELSLSLETEPGIISFLEPREWVEESEFPGSLVPTVDPAEFGVTLIRSTVEAAETNTEAASRGDFGPIPVEMMGLDEDGRIWIVTAGVERDSWLVDLWLAENATTIHYAGGSTFVQVGDQVIRLFNTSGRGQLVADGASLVGAARFDAGVFAFVVDHGTGDLVIVDFSGEQTVIFPVADQPPGGIDRVHVGGELLLVVGGDDQRWFEYRSLSGEEVGESASPSRLYSNEWGFTDNVGENTYHGATLSADGSTLYWVEQQAPDPGTFQPTIELHAMTTATGDEAEVVLLTLPPTQVRLDYSLALAGDQLLLTRSWEPQQFAAPIVVDPVAGTWTELDLPAGAWATGS